MPHGHNITYSAPVGSIAREWHAIECLMLVELLSDSGQGGID